MGTPLTVRIKPVRMSISTAETLGHELRFEYNELPTIVACDLCGEQATLTEDNILIWQNQIQFCLTSSNKLLSYSNVPDYNERGMVSRCATFSLVSIPKMVHGDVLSMSPAPNTMIVVLCYEYNHHAANPEHDLRSFAVNGVSVGNVYGAVGTVLQMLCEIDPQYLQRGS